MRGGAGAEKHSNTTQHNTAAPGKEDLGVALARAQTNASNGG
jgi:hypothetical protein